MRHLLAGRNPSEKNVALGLVPSLGRGTAGTPELRHSYVAIGPKNVPIAGCAQGECSAGAESPAWGGARPALPNSSFVSCDWSQACANCGVKGRGM